MTGKKIGFGIIGTGAIAKIHAESIADIENAELIALSSSSVERAAKAHTEYNLPVYSNYQELLHHKDIDVVIICTQSGSHLEPTLETARQGKHVLCEKPLEISLNKVDEMIDACKSAGVQLGCIFQNRFSADYIAMKNAVQVGLLGKILMANASINWYRDADYYKNSPWRGTLSGDGGAALINQGIHTIDLLLDLVGNASSVFGKIKTNVHDIEGEDTAIALVTFDNGTMGTITGSTALYPGHPERLEVFGEKGSIILEAGKITAWNVAHHEREVINQSSTESSGAANPMAIGHHLHRLQIEDMIAAITSDKSPAVDGQEGRRAVELILGIYESSKGGKEIHFTQ